MRFGLCVHHKTTFCFFSDRASISFQWVIKFIFCFTILHFKWILELIDLNSTFWLYPRIWWSDQLSHKLNFIFCRWNQNKKMNTWDHKARSLFPSRLHFNTEKMSSHLTIFILLIRKQSRVFWSQQTLGLTWKEQTIKRLTPKIEMDALSSLDLEFLPLVMSPCVDDNSIHHTSHAISSVTVLSLRRHRLFVALQAITPELIWNKFKIQNRSYARSSVKLIIVSDFYKCIFTIAINFCSPLFIYSSISTIFYSQLLVSSRGHLRRFVNTTIVSHSRPLRSRLNVLKHLCYLFLLFSFTTSFLSFLHMFRL